MKKEIADVEQMRDAMKKIQGEKRFAHTLGVAETASRLAAVYGADRQKALIAGLLHDCAKPMTGEKLLDFCKRHGIGVTEAEQKAPSLLHAKAGAYLARQEYGVEDTDVLNAIRYHTTGRENMSLLEQIVFVADYVEPGRDKAPRLAQIREMAETSLDQATVWILEDTLGYLEAEGAVIDPASRRTLQYYQNAAKKSGEK